MNSSACAKAAVVIFFFSSLSLSALERHWYLSDAAGIAYRETSAILSRNQAWVLEIRSSKIANEVFNDDFPLPDEFLQAKDATLFELTVLREYGVEKISCASAFTASGLPLVRYKRELERERIERFNAFGDLTEEIVREEGRALERRVLVHENQQLREVLLYEVLPDDGELLVYRDRYRYRRDGSLRAIQRKISDEEVSGLVLSSKQGRTQRMELLSKDGSSTVLAFDDRARERARYTRADAISNVAAVELTLWDPVEEDAAGENRISKRVEYPDATGKGRRVEEYNENGELIIATRYAEEGHILERSERLWEAGVLTAIITERGDQIYETRYERNKQGELTMETQLLNGTIQKRIRITRGEGTVFEEEEVYIDGTLRLLLRRENGEFVSEKRIRLERKD